MKNVKFWCGVSYVGTDENGKSKVGGFGTVLAYGYKTKQKYGFAEFVGNSSMESLSIIAGLTSLKRYDIELDIFTDSKYVIDVCNKKIDEWRLDNWCKAKEENIPYLSGWMFISSSFERIKQCGGNVCMHFINKKCTNELYEVACDLAEYAVKTKTNNYE